MFSDVASYKVRDCSSTNANEMVKSLENINQNDVPAAGSSNEWVITQDGDVNGFSSCQSRTPSTKILASGISDQTAPICFKVEGQTVDFSTRWTGRGVRLEALKDSVDDHNTKIRDGMLQAFINPVITSDVTGQVLNSGNIIFKEEELLKDMHSVIGELKLLQENIKNVTNFLGYTTGGIIDTLECRIMREEMKMMHNVFCLKNTRMLIIVRSMTVWLGPLFLFVSFMMFVRLDSQEVGVEEEKKDDKKIKVKVKEKDKDKKDRGHKYRVA